MQTVSAPLDECRDVSRELMTSACGIPQQQNPCRVLLRGENELAEVLVFRQQDAMGSARETDDHAVIGSGPPLGDCHDVVTSMS